ncbi:MAG: hypothetical protein HYT78_15240 [Deltaproteobacteria bacterium]|nr:hypothetical protein [Deltaproteobacteria bacterium]
MRGVPHDLDLSRFVGATLIQLCLGEFQVQFHFQAAGSAGSEGMLYIGVERGWELRDGSGALVDHSQSNAERDVYRVHRLLGLTVAGTALDAPRSFALRFRNGHELRIFDDSDRYESFSIQPGDIFI